MYISVSLLAVSSLVLFLLCTPPHAQVVADSICDVDLAHSKGATIDTIDDNIYSLYFSDKECVSKVVSEGQKTPIEIFRFNPRLSYILEYLPQAQREIAASMIFSNGTRLNFVLEDERAMAVINDQYVDASLQAFIASSRLVSLEGIEGFLDAREEAVREDVALYIRVPSGGFGASWYRAYCEDSGRCIASSSRNCSLENPFAIKLRFVDDDSLMLDQLLDECGADITSVTRFLRVLGVLDGMCSLPLQSLVLQDTRSIDASQCANALLEMENFGVKADIDGPSLIFHAQRYGFEKYLDAARYFDPKLAELLLRIRG